MDKDISGACWWKQSLSDWSSDINNSSRLTSVLWKQLVEENDVTDICNPSSRSGRSTFDKNLPTEQSATLNSSSLLSNSLGIWQIQQSPSEELNTHEKVMKEKDPWEQLINSNQVSSDRRDSLNPSLASDVILQSGLNVNRIPSIVDQDNIYQAVPGAIGSCKKESNFIATAHREFKNPESSLFPTYEDLTDGIWDPYCNTSYGYSSFVTSNEADSYGQNNSTSRVQIPASLSQRQPYHDIGNTSQPSLKAPPKVCYPHPFQAPIDFTSAQEPSVPYHFSMQESNSDHGTPFHPQRQHTDLVSLMQELSMVLAAGDAGHLPHSMQQTFPHKKISAITQSSVKHCVFCKNNNYHATFYKSHTLKDDYGQCQCPVLRMYVCPLCKASGNAAHTLKYCPKNAVTHGDPISVGLPPGKVISWRQVADRIRGHYD